MHTAINKIAEDKAREKTKGIPIHYSVKKQEENAGDNDTWYWGHK